MGYPESGGGREGVKIEVKTRSELKTQSVGKQHDDLKKRTMDKMMENTMKTGMNTKLPMTNESSPMMMTHIGNVSGYGGWEVVCLSLVMILTLCGIFYDFLFFIIGYTIFARHTGMTRLSFRGSSI